MMDIVTLVMACSIFQDFSITHAMIQVGSKNNYLMVTPVGGSSTIFPTEAQATAFVAQQLQQGNDLAIGITQLPSRWLKTYNVTPVEIVRPCKNVAIASEIITQMWEKCGHIVSDPSDPQKLQACALSMFKTGSATAGLDYARQVMAYAQANSFDKVAAPAMQRWEKTAKVPKMSAAAAAKIDNNSASATNAPATSDSADNSDNINNSDTDNTTAIQDNASTMSDNANNFDDNADINNNN